MPNDVFVKRRLQQLVREELARTDMKALVQEVVREFLREDERDWHDQQQRHALKR